MNKKYGIASEEITQIQAFLEGHARPARTMSFHELLGFLYAVATAPDRIPSSEWLPVIGEGSDLNFADKNEAESITRTIKNLYKTTNRFVSRRSGSLPFMGEFRPIVLDNFDADAPISLWSKGFVKGHAWLEKLWEDILPKELEDEFSTNVVVLTFFSLRDIAENHYQRFARPDDIRAENFELFADSMRDLFPAAIRDFAKLGRSMNEAAALGSGPDY